MKRWLSLFSVLLLLALGGCATKQYTPDVTADFEQSAVVTAGDFSYHCKVCRTEGTVTVTVGDTAARGMVMTCAGTMVRYRFDGMEYEARAQDLENTNPAIALYDVFSALQQDGTVQAQKTQDGYKYQGTVPAGKFVLYQNEDGSYVSLHFLSSNILIEFDPPTK